MITLPPLRGITGKLGFRLALLLTISLSPLTLISVRKSFDAVEQAQAASQTALTGETSRVAAPQLRLIEKAQTTAAALARIVGSVSDTSEHCSEVMARVAGVHGPYALVGYIPLSGIMRCSSADGPYDLSKNASFVQMAAAPQPGFTVKRLGPVTDLSVLAVSYPVFDRYGIYEGIILVSVLRSALNAVSPVETGTTPLAVVTFDRKGELLTWPSQLPDVMAVLPRDRPLADFVDGAPVVFSALSNSGGTRVFSVVALVPGEFYALGTWAPQGLMTHSSGAWLAPILSPVIIFFASLFLAWLGVERLVIRHVLKIRKSINSFAGGNRVVGEIDVARAPLELREMADAYRRMTETILYDEAELEDMVHQKEVLLREVHHRVKNNLQLIASITNLQMRRARTPEAREMMTALQDRIISLATVNRELYQTAGLTDIHVDQLLVDIVRQVVNLASAPHQHLEVRTAFANIKMTPDQAVPLALLLTEALTNAIKYAGTHTATVPLVEISLTRVGEVRAELTVANMMPALTGPPEVDTNGITGIGNQLLDAFAQQLGATIVRSSDEGKYRLTSSFDLLPLTEAEARNSARSEEQV